MFGREENIRLNKIKPKAHISTAVDRQIRNYKGNISNKIFFKNDSVFIRDYSKPNKKSWKTCIIDESVGNNIYICKEQLTNRYFKRHADQIIKSNISHKDAGKLISKPELNEGNSPTQTAVLEVPKESVNIDNPEVYDNTDNSLVDCSSTSMLGVNTANKNKRNICKPKKFNDFICY